MKNYFINKRSINSKPKHYFCYSTNKKDSSIPEKLYNFYKERGYYEEAIKWYRKYAKVGGVTAVEKKNVEEDLKARGFE